MLGKSLGTILFLVNTWDMFCWEAHIQHLKNLGYEVTVESQLRVHPAATLVICVGYGDTHDWFYNDIVSGVLKIPILYIHSCYQPDLPDGISHGDCLAFPDLATFAAKVAELISVR